MCYALIHYSVLSYYSDYNILPSAPYMASRTFIEESQIDLNEIVVLNHQARNVMGRAGWMTGMAG